MTRYTVAAVAIGLALAGCGSSTKATQSPHASSAVAAFNRLPASAFPATVSRAQAPELGTLTFRLSFLGHPVTLTSSAASVSRGQVGTLARTGSEFVLRFTQLRYRVAPIKLPNGLTLASQTIALEPGAPSALHINRSTGAVSADVRWVVDAPNALYNGSHTIDLADVGQRRFVSVRQIGPGRYSFNIVSHWRGSVTLTRWSVGGRDLPAGPVTMAGTWNGAYVLTAKP